MERYPSIGDTHYPGIFVPDVPVQGLKCTADGRTFSHYTWCKCKYCEADSHHCVCLINSFCRCSKRLYWIYRAGSSPYDPLHCRSGSQKTNSALSSYRRPVHDLGRCGSQNASSADGNPHRNPDSIYRGPVIPVDDKGTSIRV